MVEPVPVDPRGKFHFVGVVAAVALTAAIVVAVWSQFRSANPASPDLGDGTAGGPWQTRRQIQEMGPDTWRVWSAPAIMEIVGSPPKSVDFRLRWWSLMGADPSEHGGPALTGRTDFEQARSLLPLLRVGRDKRAAAAVAATPEQVQRIQAIQVQRAMINDADQAHLLELWNAYQSAAATNDQARRTAAEQALLDELHRVGESSIEPTRKAWTDAVATIQATLTPEQINRFRQYETKWPPPPGYRFGLGPSMSLATINPSTSTSATQPR
jgi:hypothetical protein